MQKRRNAFLAAILLLVAAISSVFMYVNQSHQSVEKLAADKNINAEKLYNDYTQNENKADSEYLNKVIAVTGELKSKLVQNKNYFLLIKASEQGNINCQMMMSDTALLNSLSVSKKVVIKGKCTGYLMDVNMVDCVLSK